MKSEWTGEKINIYIYTYKTVPPNQLRKPITVIEHQKKLRRWLRFNYVQKNHIRIKKAERINERRAELAPPSAVPGCLPAEDNGSLSIEGSKQG